MRILVSGGGTAGHISPILATVDALKSLDKEAEILYVGQARGMEARMAAAAGLQFAGISAGKFRRYHNARLFNKLTDLSTLGLNARDLGRFVVGLNQSRRIIKQFQPDVVFIKGGYVGLPVGLAAAMARVPLVVHESDTVPGLTNKFLAKWATKVATAFPPDKLKELPLEKAVQTGLPIRAEVLKAHRLEGLAKFRLNPELPVIFVTGGSGGAAAINQVVIEALPELVRRYQVLHVTGDREIEHVRFEVKRLDLDQPKHYQPHAFLMAEWGMALAVADLVISRAGATAIAELASLRKPTILVPAPHLVGGHQESNALVLARAGAVRMIQQSKLSSRSLIAEIERVLGSQQEQDSLSANISQFAVPDAAEKLAKVILAAGEARGE